MAESDRRSNDGWDANDLPLNPIPATRETRRPTPRPTSPRESDGGVGRYVVAIAILFGLIVSISFIAGPYVRLPGGGASTAAVPVPAAVTVAEDSAPLRVEEIPIRVGEQALPPVLAAPAPLPQATPAAPATLVTASQAAEPASILETTRHTAVRAVPVADPAPVPVPDPVSDPVPDSALARRVGELERELAKRTKSLEETRAAHDDARKGMRDAEREHDKRLRATEAEFKKKHEARVTELQAQLTQAVTARDEVSERSGKQIAELEGRLAAADQRVSSAEGTLQQKKSAHAVTLEGESKAVRSMLGDLNRTRDELAAEKKARSAAEARVRELEGAGQSARRSTASAAPAAAAAMVPTTAVPPAPATTTPPERVTTVPPRYPDDLRQTGVTGRVVLRMLIDELGNVSEVELESSPHPQLTNAATRAAWQWKYNPARRNSLRVKMWINEAVDFQL